VPHLELDARHVAVRDGDVPDQMEGVPKLEHSGGRKEVARVRVRDRKDRGALSDGVERKGIDRFDERVRAVAPVDATCVFERPLGVKPTEVSTLWKLSTSVPTSVPVTPGRQSCVSPVSMNAVVMVSRMMMGAAEAVPPISAPTVNNPNSPRPRFTATTSLAGTELPSVAYTQPAKRFNTSRLRQKPRRH
jgi:hypothetical protein